MDGVVTTRRAAEKASPKTSLSLAEARRRAARIRLVITDCDGVLTDGGVYYSERGEELKRFDIRDGMGVQRLREAGIETGIMTGERSGSVQRRAEKLAITKVWLGVSRKDTAFAESGLNASEVAYIGDDHNDLGILALVSAAGLTGCPADALPAVRAAVHHRVDLPGGHGAFRSFAEWILQLRTRVAPAPRPRRAR